ncbi:MAG: molybdenum cofactor biosynthesis protein MoaE [Planctomycetota bacterium]
MIEITDRPIDAAKMLAAAQQPSAGAVVLFLGITREFTGVGDALRQTDRLTYEAHRPMAEAELARLEAAARERWPLVACHVVHRLGEVPLAEASVAIVASSPHRAGAFEAGRWLIDELKRSAPIWKREHFADGSTEWVHPSPTTPPRAESPAR